MQVKAVHCLRKAVKLVQRLPRGNVPQAHCAIAKRGQKSTCEFVNRKRRLPLGRPLKASAVFE